MLGLLETLNHVPPSELEDHLTIDVPELPALLPKLSPGSGVAVDEQTHAVGEGSQTPPDLKLIAWNATTAGIHAGSTFSASASGTIALAPPVQLERNLTSIQGTLDSVRLDGVHLDELGTRNVWMLTLRAVGSVLLAVALILLVLSVAFRM